jgi:NSS family neurotransmitter:Na+ symporter
VEDKKKIFLILKKMRHTSSRPQWLNNFVYILAAIGCAAGLGNLWRFSMLAYEYGGAAFILVLLLSNVMIVFPLLMMETFIGQKFQLSAPQAMEKLKARTSWIQWIGVFTCLVILMYYVPIMAWGIKYFFLSFSGDFLADPSGYFATEILHLSDGIDIPGGFQWSILGALILGYLVALYALRKNVSSLGPVVKITATAPFILLLILLVRGVTLPGAEEGIRALFIPDWSALGNIKLWQAAIGQSFFSASLAMTYFIVAASHRPPGSEIPRTSAWILVGNFGVSILAGITVFSTIGFMAAQQGVPVSEAATGGPMLVFSILPTAVSLMPTGAIFFAALLFLVVITLAIDSIFGILEVVAGAFHDLWAKRFSYFKVLVGVILVCGIGAFPFLMGSGMYYLDIIDHFVAGYCLLILGMLETIVVAYVIGPEKVRQWINKTSDFKIPKVFNVVLYIIPFVLAGLIGVTLFKEIQEVYGGYPMEYIVQWGFIPLGIVFILSAVFGVLTYRSVISEENG